MKVIYSKDREAAYQTLSIDIEADAGEMFPYLGTTKGISQWFPQLAFSEDENILKLTFDLGDGNYEELEVREYDEPECNRF